MNRAGIHVFLYILPFYLFLKYCFAVVQACVIVTGCRHGGLHYLVLHNSHMHAILAQRQYAGVCCVAVCDNCPYPVAGLHDAKQMAVHGVE